MGLFWWTYEVSPTMVDSSGNPHFRVTRRRGRVKEEAHLVRMCPTVWRNRNGLDIDNRPEYGSSVRRRIERAWVKVNQPEKEWVRVAPLPLARIYPGVSK